MQTRENTLLYTKEGKFRLDIETGEWIKVRPYKWKKTVVRAKMDDGTEKVFTWNAEPVDIPYVDDDIKEMQLEDSNRGRKPNVYCNAYIQGMLEPCQHYSNATLTFPFLQSTLTAVAGFHDGTRSISTHTLYKLLSTLKSVTTATVEDATGYSERYARKVVKAVKVASKELTRLMKNYSFEYVEGEVAVVSKEQCLVDRAEYVQWFTEQQLLGKYEGFPVPK
jgi:hypothetical protein